MILKITEPGKRWRKADGGATSSQLKRRRDLNLEAARLQADDGGSERPLDTGSNSLSERLKTAGLLFYVSYGYRQWTTPYNNMIQ